MTNRPRVLISAYACEPGEGSEPGLGWNWVNQIANIADVWVITRANNKKAIEKELSKNRISEIKWVYYDLPDWILFFKRGSIGIQIYYYLWQVGIVSNAREIVIEKHIDIIQHVTFARYWTPSFLALFPNTFIWGPVGGGASTPWKFFQTFSFRGKVYELLRYIIKWIVKFDPIVRATAQHSDITISVTPETKQEVVKLGANPVELIPQVGVDQNYLIENKANVRTNGVSGRYIFISIGRLLHWKGFHLGLEAFARVVEENSNIEYWFIGDGPERKNLDKVVENNKLQRHVKFLGRLSRDETITTLSLCDTLVHPSLHDSGGMVCLEAMGLGKPVICLDLGGPAVIVDDKSGFVIPARNPDQVIDEIASSMERLVSNPQLAETLGENAKKRVLEKFTWDKKGEVIASIYEDLTST